MPLAQEIDVSSILSPYNGTGKVIKQTGYTGVWWKQSGSTWEGYSTQPSGTVQEVNFTSLVPSPVSGVIYNMNYGAETPIYYHGTANICTFHWTSTDSKWKCGTPA